MKTINKILTTILVLSGLTYFVKGQTRNFSKVYSGAGSSSVWAYSIAKTPDNNYIVAGEKDGAGLIFKIDSTGNIKWIKRYDLISYLSFSNIIPTDDSCFIVTGNIIVGDYGNYQMCCIKLILKVIQSGLGNYMMEVMV